MKRGNKMGKAIINVEGMSCKHCVNAITNALQAQPGITKVEVDLDAKTVTTEHDPTLSPIENIKAEIENQGFDIVES